MGRTVVRNSTPSARPTLSWLFAFRRQSLSGPRTIERAFEQIVTFTVEVTEGGYGRRDAQHLQARELVPRLRSRVDQMLGNADQLFEPFVENEASQLQVHQPFRDPKTGLFRVRTAGVPELEQAFIASVTVYIQNHIALLGLCTRCGGLFVRPRAASKFCGEKCRLAYRDESNRPAAAARKNAGYDRKTEPESRRGRPRKYQYPETVATPRPQGHEEV